MIGYVTIGTNDFDRAVKFYDAIAEEMGAQRAMDFGAFVLWSNGQPGGMLALCKPYDQQPASVGNGGMTALAAKDKAQVDRLHALALSLGGTDEGAPGPRSDTFYAAYFRDLDGNKLAAFHLG
ncbi:MAG TPA: VOC family protein [Caulobacteraceae bacterium]|nr:VOC family protein [Caulobacteraceae bacterium]